VDLQGQFAYERTKRELQDCDDLERLRSIALDSIGLYLAQQATIREMAKRGWLND
jgi:hypothetical protein